MLVLLILHECLKPFMLYLIKQLIACGSGAFAPIKHLFVCLFVFCVSVYLVVLFLRADRTLGPPRDRTHRRTRSRGSGRGSGRGSVSSSSSVSSSVSSSSSSSRSSRSRSSSISKGYQSEKVDSHVSVCTLSSFRYLLMSVLRLFVILSPPRKEL